MDNQLTSMWTTSWSANRKKVDNQLTLQDIHTYIYVGGTFRVYVAILASAKITENVVRNGVHRYKMLHFLGTLQEPTVNTVETRILWVVMRNLKHCWPPQNTVKQAVFRCLTLKGPKNCHIDPDRYRIHTYIYIHIYRSRHEACASQGQHPALLERGRTRACPVAWTSKASLMQHLKG